MDFLSTRCRIVYAKTGMGLRIEPGCRGPEKLHFLAIELQHRTQKSNHLLLLNYFDGG